MASMSHFDLQLIKKTPRIRQQCAHGQLRLVFTVWMFLTCSMFISLVDIDGRVQGFGTHVS